MPGPYNPPNPYGSYFAFGQPEDMTRQFYGPMPFGILSPGAMAMTGVGSGGFNPSSSEFLAGKVRSQYQQQFMAELLRNDPRAANITSMLLSNMNAASQKSTLNFFGGRGNLQELVAYAMSQPGIAPLVGGSSYGLGQGAYAATSSGMRVGGLGGGFIANDGAGAMLGASALVSHMTRQFYFQGGAANPTMTSGLNRDQIGGIMMLGAAQGAFGGMNLGDLVAKGSALHMKIDQNTMNRISQFTKTAAKALSGLIDVYGDQSIVELASKAQQITGLNLSRIGNPELIQQRLSSLRQTGLSMGVDTSTMFDLSAMSTRMGMNMGMSESYAGSVAEMAANHAAALFRANQAQAGSFNTATLSQQEIAANITRDQAAMSKDPVGRRKLALQLGVESGQFGSAADEARRLMREDGPGAMGRIDQFMRSQGINTDAYIRLMGGPSGIQSMLSESGKEAVQAANADSVNQRARQMLRIQAVSAFGSRAVGTGGQALMGAIEGIDKVTLAKIFEATKGGDTSSVEKLLQQDPAGRLDTANYAKLIRTAVSELGGEGAKAMHANLQQAISANTFLSSSFMTTSGKLTAANQRMNVLMFTDADRGAMRSGTLAEGLLKRMSGRDPRSNYVRAHMMYHQSEITDLHIPAAGEAFDLNKTRDTASRLVKGMHGSQQGQAALAALGLAGVDPATMTLGNLQELHQNLASEIVRDRAFKDYQLAKFGSTYNMMSRHRIEHANKWGGAAQVARKFQATYEASDPMGVMIGRVGDFLADPNRKDAEQALDALVRHTSDIATLEKISVKDLKLLAEGSPVWAGQMASFLEPQMTSAIKKEDEDLQDRIKVLQDVFGKYKSSSSGGGSIMSIEGKLELVGDALKLKEVIGNVKK